MSSIDASTIWNGGDAFLRPWACPGGAHMIAMAVTSRDTIVPMLRFFIAASLSSDVQRLRQATRWKAPVQRPSGPILTSASLLGRLVANVRIKGPLANIAFLVELWIYIRSRARSMVGG